MGLCYLKLEVCSAIDTRFNPVAVYNKRRASFFTYERSELLFHPFLSFQVSSDFTGGRHTRVLDVGVSAREEKGHGRRRVYTIGSVRSSLPEKQGGACGLVVLCSLKEGRG